MTHLNLALMFLSLVFLQSLQIKYQILCDIGHTCNIKKKNIIETYIRKAFLWCTFIFGTPNAWNMKNIGNQNVWYTTNFVMTANILFILRIPSLSQRKVDIREGKLEQLKVKWKTKNQNSGLLKEKEIF